MRVNWGEVYQECENGDWGTEQSSCSEAQSEEVMEEPGYPPTLWTTCDPSFLHRQHTKHTPLHIYTHVANILHSLCYYTHMHYVTFQIYILYTTIVYYTILYYTVLYYTTLHYTGAALEAPCPALFLQNPSASPLVCIFPVLSVCSSILVQLTPQSNLSKSNWKVCL